MTCQKVPYTKLKAKRTIRSLYRLKKAEKDTLCKYWCDRCSAYHVGHKRLLDKLADKIWSAIQ